MNGFDRSTSGNSYNFIQQHGTAVVAANTCFDTATNEALLAGVISLNDYPIVDIILGEESTADETFSNSEQLLFSEFL